MNYKHREILASNTLPKEEEAFTHLLASIAADYAEQIGIFINGFSMPEIPIVIAAMKTATTALEYYVQDATGPNKSAFNDCIKLSDNIYKELAEIMATIFANEKEPPNETSNP